MSAGFMIQSNGLNFFLSAPTRGIPPPCPVNMITSMVGLYFFISSSVSMPSMRGIFKSSKTTSGMFLAWIRARASSVQKQAVVSKPLIFRRSARVVANSISSSTTSTFTFDIMHPPTQVSFNWQDYSKGCTYPYGTSDRNMSTEFFNNTVGYEQSEAGTFLFAAVFCSKEWFENMAYNIL